MTHLRRGEESTLRVDAAVRSSTLGRTVSTTPVERSIETDLLSAFNSTETRPVNASTPPIEDPVLYVNETGAAWGEVTRRETPIRMAFVVYNPKAVPYPVTEVGYVASMNGIEVAEGTTDREYVVAPKSTATIETTARIDNAKLDEWWVTHLERNQVTELRIDFYARIELPTGQTVRVPLDAVTYTETMETDIFGTKNGSAPAGSGTPAGGGSGAGTPADTATPRGTADGRTPTEAPDRTPAPTETAAPTLTPTEIAAPTLTPTRTPTETPTPDGGLLDDGTPKNGTDVLG